MKKLLLLSLLFSTVAVQYPTNAQQVNYYQTCKGYREKYVPGYVDANGNFIQGYTTTEEYPTQCGYQSYDAPERPRRRYERPQRRCPTSNTVLGALLGGGTAAAIAKKDSWSWAIPLGAVLGGGAATAACES